MKTKTIERDKKNNIRWIEITGCDHNTNYEFNKNTYGIIKQIGLDIKILDCAGSPLTPGDYEYIAVNNALEEQRREWRQRDGNRGEYMKKYAAEKSESIKDTRDKYKEKNAEHFTDYNRKYWHKRVKQ